MPTELQLNIQFDLSSLPSSLSLSLFPTQLCTTSTSGSVLAAVFCWKRESLCDSPHNTTALPNYSFNFALVSHSLFLQGTQECNPVGREAFSSHSSKNCPLPTLSWQEWKVVAFAPILQSNACKICKTGRNLVKIMWFQGII